MRDLCTMGLTGTLGDGDLESTRLGAMAVSARGQCGDAWHGIMEACARDDVEDDNDDEDDVDDETVRIWCWRWGKRVLESLYGLAI